MNIVLKQKLHLTAILIPIKWRNQLHIIEAIDVSSLSMSLAQSQINWK